MTKKYCELCGRRLSDNDPGDAGTEYDIDVCCLSCACALEEEDLNAIRNLQYAHKLKNSQPKVEHYT